LGRIRSLARIIRSSWPGSVAPAATNWFTIVRSPAERSSAPPPSQNSENRGIRRAFARICSSSRLRSGTGPSGAVSLAAGGNASACQAAMAADRSSMRSNPSTTRPVTET